MAALSRTETIASLGEVKVTKKRGLSRITLRLHHSGQIRVSQPYYLPFAAGFKFAKTQYDWILKQQAKEQPLRLTNGMTIGKNYTFKIQTGNSITSRLKAADIVITKPENVSPNDSVYILEAKKAIKRALIKDAKETFPSRVQELATAYGYNYSQVKTKPMKTRWGSCSSAKTITLNCYLLMMPWPIIDYVIMHELAHTKHMNHSPAFWAEVASTTSNYKDLKKQIKLLQPQVHAYYV